MTELDKIAGDVVAGKLNEDAAQEKVGDMCTRHGPSAVQVLDRYYESRLTGLRKP
jgi:hypothetical protein